MNLEDSELLGEVNARRRQGDLFSEVYSNCGSCAHCVASRFGGHFCDLSKMGITPEGAACRCHAPIKEST
jgi:hypothetical protein